MKRMSIHNQSLANIVACAAMLSLLTVNLSAGEPYPSPCDTILQAGQQETDTFAKRVLAFMDTTLEVGQSVEIPFPLYRYSISEYAKKYRTNTQFQSECKAANIDTRGYKATVYNPYLYVTDEALSDLQQAVLRVPKNTKQRHSIDYSPYFTNKYRRHLGKKYSDFLVSLVRRHCKDINIPLPPTSPCPQKSWQNFRVP